VEVLLKQSRYNKGKGIRDGMNLNPGDKITIVVENDKICIENYSLTQSNFLHLVMKS